MKKWLRCPESIKALLPSTRELASSGLNKGHIGRQLGFHPNSFNKYKEFADAFENGRSDLARDVAKSFKENLSFSYSDRVHLSKALRLYSGSFHLEPIKDMKSAQNAMSASLLAFAEGTISIEDMEAVRKALATYVDSVTSTVLEERLQAIEDTLDGKIQKSA